MSHPKIKKAKSADDRTLPVFAEFEQIAGKIRARALELSRRGNRNGMELQDWLDAEKEYCWPAAELLEKKSSFKINVALAGFRDEEVTVTASPDEVIVKAKHVSRSEDDNGDAEVLWSGFSSNEVFRRIELPARIDVNALKAKLKRGMLRITAPKAKTGKKPGRKKN